ncbi:GNAT family N-acetyltransferase [Paraburkholderia acidicola]|uniref:GNAT family N-acetyltransferase n=1 Tax=Paraburkholderia acidicola TaxID=1912599 RepID=A0ABV1LLH8_9BURK
MSEHHEIFLFNRQTSEMVEASLVEDADLGVGVRADLAWSSMRSVSVANSPVTGSVPQHDHWEWGKKMEYVQGLLSYTTFSVECNGDVQGLMMVKTADEFASLPTKPGLPLVYIAYLQTAPWNWGPAATQPKYRGVGSALLLAAINMSLDLEFHGRIGLHSLAQSESWYLKQGMTKLGDSAKKNGLTYFEMAEQSARQFADGSDS